MVVVSAAVISRGGRILLGRAFIDLSKSRLEGYLQSFPKLVGVDSQHTFIETESIRYVYQPMESIYVVLITTKNSNIMEDLETLRLFSKLLPEYCGGQSEEQILSRVYELSFAVDELLTHGGYRENVTLQQIKTFTEMDSHEEKLQKIITESKINQARDEARRKAQDIDQQKAQMRQAQAMAGGGGGGKYSSYGSENSRSEPVREKYERREESIPEPSPKIKPPSANDANKAKVKGMQLSKAKKTDDFFASLSKEEKLAPATGKVSLNSSSSSSAASAASSASSAASAGPKQSVRVLVDEKILAVLDKEGGVKKLEIKGEIKLSIYDPDDSKILLLTSGPLHEKDGFKCRLHPKINKNLWNTNGTLGLAEAGKPFPVGSDNAPIIVKWRKESTSEDDVPLTLNFWPNVEDGHTVVSVEYSAERAKSTLTHVQISIPCPTRDAPEVANCDGEFKFDSAKKLLHWRIATIDENNRNGSMEFKVPEIDGDEFFPIQITFDATSTLSQLAVTGVVQAENQEQQVKYDCETLVGVEKYTVE